MSKSLSRERKPALEKPEAQPLSEQQGDPAAARPALIGASKREQDLSKAFGRLVDLLARPLGPELFQHGIDALRVLLNASYGAVVLKDDQGQLKEGIFSGNTPGKPKNLQTLLKQRRPLIDRVLDTQSPLVISDVPGYLNSISFPLGHPIMHTFIGVPISREHDCFGCIYLCGETDEQQFTEQHRLVVTSFSRALALILAQAKDRAERKRLVQEREIFSSLGLQLSAADTFDKAAAIVCQVTDQYWNWHSIAISIRRSGNSRFRYLKVASKEGVVTAQREGDEFDYSAIAGFDDIVTDRSIIVPSADPDSGCCLVASVRVEADEIALLEVTAQPGQNFIQADRAFAVRLCDTLGPTFARHQAESRTRAFLTLAFKLTATTTAEDAARIIVATADELLGWDSCSVNFHFPEVGLWQGILHIDIIDGLRQDVFNPYTLMVPPGPIAQQTMAEGPQLILRDPSLLNTEGLKTFGDNSRRSLSLMFVPFRVGTSICGVFSIQSYSAQAYNLKDLQLLQALADYCVGAVERIRLAQGIPAPIDYRPSAGNAKPAPRPAIKKPKRPRVKDDSTEEP